MPSGEQIFNAAIEQQLGGNLGEAERLYKIFLADHPERDDAHFGYGLLCLGDGRKEDAVRNFERALFLSPGNVDYWANLATANFSMGRIADAQYAHLRALRIEPGNTEIKKLREDFAARPHMFGEGGIQSAHAPARQVYMSAAVDLLKDTAAPLRILEIGSYMGASLQTWADAAERLYGAETEILCIDPWGDTGAAQYRDKVCGALESQVAYEIFRHNAKLAAARPNISVTGMRATSREALPFLGELRFQLIYVDGGHFYDDTLFDITECHRLLAPGGIMCGDDLELQAHQCDYDFLQANKAADFIAGDDGTEFHPGVTLAVAEFFGKVSAFNGFWAMRKLEGGAYAAVDFKNARGLLPVHWPGNLQRLARDQIAENQSLGTLVA
ncbi:MAG: tetratricopeptide repeat protein [Rhodospirillaceae bacterium]|jgi:SAM-dependent methyltransferase|nr:tetratricopeptide repeat protein [Rhodospirillaceae bacterium]MBT3884414.1 tetratricopeptide repeat protein [Rhodospirillaceae bacterium]MBT4717813.1 tetratricopeptide repeat protein [Rhodospirillaceae bacterium]MBT5181384.1 tetratricopeptide repeat protein [Rhodospirillaceae bacterium]MBT5841175.1 tetratricopeptide repeat protein [Rhodospirillaceae bacterium]